MGRSVLTSFFVFITLISFQVQAEPISKDEFGQIAEVFGIGKSSCYLSKYSTNDSNWVYSYYFEDVNQSDAIEKAKTIVGSKEIPPELVVDFFHNLGRHYLIEDRYMHSVYRSCRQEKYFTKVDPKFYFIIWTKPAAIEVIRKFINGIPKVDSDFDFSTHNYVKALLSFKKEFGSKQQKYIAKDIDVIIDEFIKIGAGTPDYCGYLASLESYIPISSDSSLVVQNLQYLVEKSVDSYGIDPNQQTCDGSPNLLSRLLKHSLYLNYSAPIIKFLYGRGAKLENSSIGLRHFLEDRPFAKNYSGISLISELNELREIPDDFIAPFIRHSYQLMKYSSDLGEGIVEFKSILRMVDNVNLSYPSALWDLLDEIVRNKNKKDIEVISKPFVRELVEEGIDLNYSFLGQSTMDIAIKSEIAGLILYLCSKGAVHEVCSY